MEFYKRIKQRRIELGITQQELAEKIGFKTKGAICKLEAGLRNINQTQIAEFATVLQTTPAYLMGWEDSTEEVKQDISSAHISHFVDSTKEERIKTTTNISSNNFGATLQHLRHLKKMTQSQLANVLSLKTSTISMYENNLRSPDLKTLKLIADYFDISLDILCGRHSTQNTDFSDNITVKLLNELTPEEVTKVTAFIQGIIANR